LSASNIIGFVITPKIPFKPARTMYALGHMFQVFAEKLLA